MPPQRTIASSKEGKIRRRSLRACRPCRKRKIKCNGQDPCEACVDYGYDCVFVEHQPHKGPSSAESQPPVKYSPIVNEIGPVPLDPEVDGTYMATEYLVKDPKAEGFLLRPLGTKFTSAYSAIAWPKALGASLDMPLPPRLQSYAWNPGNRAEPNVVPQNNLTDIITLAEVKKYTEIFFNEVNPIFGLVDREVFNQKSEELWILHKRGTDFESLTCGMIALGSYISPDPLPVEDQIVEHLRILLDLTVSHAPDWLSLNHVQAWILRAIYLRSTTRPHLAWMASNTAVHLAEALGLHRDLCESQMKNNLRQLLEKSEPNMRRKIFWIAIALNQFLAMECGRTRATIELVSCRLPDLNPNDLSLQLLAILQSVPKTQNLIGRGSELLETLQSAMILPVRAPFLRLLKADACFCTFRMLRSTNINLPTAQITSLLEVIQIALDATTRLLSIRHLWWNIVGTPFHSVCILLALGTSQSLEMIPFALETLKNVSATYDSHMSREALRTAHQLVEGARQKRRKELESLDRGMDVVGSILPYPGSSSIFSEAINFELSTNNSISGFSDFPDFLDFGGYCFENDGFILPNADLL